MNNNETWKKGKKEEEKREKKSTFVLDRPGIINRVMLSLMTDEIHNEMINRPLELIWQDQQHTITSNANRSTLNKDSLKHIYQLQDKHNIIGPFIYATNCAQY